MFKCKNVYEHQAAGNEEAASQIWIIKMFNISLAFVLKTQFMTSLLLHDPKWFLFIASAWEIFKSGSQSQSAGYIIEDLFSGLMHPDQIEVSQAGIIIKSNVRPRGWNVLCYYQIQL